MKLSLKMVLVFSTIMLLGIAVLSQYALEQTRFGASEFTKMVTSNMLTSISQELTGKFDMMSMTLDELTGNSSFTASVNTYVRDDTDDSKVGLAARNAAVQILYQSPLVDNYYRVSFFTRDGHYFSSLADKDSQLVSQSPELVEIISGIHFLDDLDSREAEHIISQQKDLFSWRSDISVYGLAKPVKYHGKTIGYIAVCNQISALDSIMNYVASPAEYQVQIVNSYGELLYSSTGSKTAYNPAETGDNSVWNAESYDVSERSVDDYGLTIYIARSKYFANMADSRLSSDIINRAIIIVLPAIALIVLLSLLLSRSINKLTKKVSKMPVNMMLDSDTPLTSFVTSPRDRETHALETAYNNMMVSLRESIMNELTLREGTLQAQLNALQTQINPHFIYNTLNIISAKSMDCGNFDVIEICDQFASMLRYSTDTHSKVATVQEEIDNVTDYLKIAKARYEENLEYTIDMPEHLAAIKVPKLTLQPLVENAINHGYKLSNDARKIDVSGYVKDGKLIIRIHDNGTGFEPAILADLRGKISKIYAGESSSSEVSAHIGLLNTCMRLHYYSKGRMHIDIENDNGAVIIITLPLNMTDND